VSKAPAADAAAPPAATPPAADADADAVEGIDETSIPKVGAGSGTATPAKKADDSATEAKSTTATTKSTTTAEEPKKKTAAAATSLDPSIAEAAAGLNALEVPDGGEGTEIDGITPPEKVDAEAADFKAREVPLTGFEPAWTKARPASSVLAELVTDTPLKDVQTNQVPLIQSLAAAANVPPSQVYFFKVTEGDPLNGITFLIDTKDEPGRQNTLRGLGDGTKTAKFYSNAKAFKVNVVNGPSVPAAENTLDAASISTPDDKGNYDLETGRVKNNQTLASAAGRATLPSSPSSVLFVLGLTTLVGSALALTA
jgi:hypothetical protein